MKQCPRCSQIYDDDNSFCLNDGTTLNAYQQISAESETPTQVLFQPSPVNGLQTNPNKFFYLIIGLLVVAVIALSLTLYAIIFLPLTNTPDQVKTTDESVSNPPEPGKKETVSVAKNNEIVPNSKLTETEPISTLTVQNLITRWEKSQDAQNFADYQACYGQPFLGIKKTKSGSVSNLNYGQWMNDRRQILRNAVGLDIEIRNQQIVLEGDTAIVSFDQYYRSVNYSDWGPKTLKIKMFSDGPKIVYEELKASYPLN